MGPCTVEPTVTMAAEAIETAAKSVPDLQSLSEKAKVSSSLMFMLAAGFVFMSQVETAVLLLPLYSLLSCPVDILRFRVVPSHAEPCLCV